MLRNVLLLRAGRNVIFSTANSQKQVTRFSSTTAASKWDLLSAVCIERHPIITQDKTDLEVKFQQLLDTIEHENSMKCDHELRWELEKAQMDLKKKGVLDADTDVMSNQTVQDLEDIWQKEYENFKFASRITEFDKKNVTTSLNRKLDMNLVLLTEQKIGNTCLWIPPQGVRQEGETMKQAAERILQDTCGKNLNVCFYGNAPVGFYKYRYPTAIRKTNGPVGAKIFYFLAKYIDGSVLENTKHQWLDRNELKNILPNDLYKSVSQFLI